MAYVAPTVDEFTTRYPAFEDVDEAAIASALAEAALRVDETWTEASFAIAQMLYCAHVLALDGFGSSPEVKLLGFRSVSIGGDLKLERGGGMSTAALGTLESTSYGVRFAELMRMNFAGPISV
jgi:hypothetical protein